MRQNAKSVCFFTLTFCVHQLIVALYAFDAVQLFCCDCGAIMVIWIILGLPSSSQTEIAYCLIQ